jgi:hypothetical protein
LSHTGSSPFPVLPFPLRSNQYKCLSWPGGHRSRPARNAVSCCWTGRWSAYYPSVQSPAWAPPAPGRGEHVTADQHDLTVDLSAESPSSEGLSRVPGFSERLPRDGLLPGTGSRPAAPGSNEPRPEDNSQDQLHTDQNKAAQRGGREDTGQDQQNLRRQAAGVRSLSASVPRGTIRVTHAPTLTTQPIRGWGQALRTSLLRELHARRARTQKGVRWRGRLSGPGRAVAELRHTLAPLCLRRCSYGRQICSSAGVLVNQSP